MAAHARSSIAGARIPPTSTGRGLARRWPGRLWRNTWSTRQSKRGTIIVKHTRICQVFSRARGELSSKWENAETLVEALGTELVRTTELEEAQ